MRTFLAIEMPPEIQQKLDSQITQLKKAHPDLSWVPAHNFHITLQFFGEVGHVEKLKKKIEDTLFDIPVFHMFALGGGIFIHHKITLYIEFQRQKTLEEVVGRVKNIAASVDQTNQINLKNKFTPHITIARYKIPSKQQYLHLKKKLEQLDIELDFPVTKLYLFQSLLEAQAPVYKKIAEFKLF